jgi:hypothetical protein
LEVKPGGNTVALGAQILLQQRAANAVLPHTATLAGSWLQEIQNVDGSGEFHRASIGKILTELTAAGEGRPCFKAPDWKRYPGIPLVHFESLDR